MKMNALSIYLAACRYVMSADFGDRNTWADLYRYLPYLRQALSCFVCRNITHAPHFASHNMCQHFVCKKCIGGRMKLKPQCSWCRNYKGFVENTELRIVALCFKKLCEYINDSPIGQDLRSLASNGETDNLVIILQEAIAFEDDFQVSSSLSLPPALTAIGIQNKPKSVKEDEPAKSSNPAPSTSTCVLNDTHESTASHHTNEKSKTTSPNVKEISSRDSSESEINVTDIGTQELSPLLSEEVIDVCQIPVIKECDKSVKRRQEPVITLEDLQNSSIFDQKLIMNCLDAKGDNRFTSTPVVEMPNKKPKTATSSSDSYDIRICKCGRGGTNSRLTCLGQRCPCYIKKLPCINCKCRGCRNPRNKKEKSEVLRDQQDEMPDITGSATQNENICVT